MKIFGWLRNSRRNGNYEEEDVKKPIPQSMQHCNQIKSESCKEEFSDWPDGLLAIGTFGNNNLKQSEKLLNQADTPAEDQFEQVDKELRLLLNNHISLDSEKQQNLSVEDLLDCLLEEENVSNNVSENKVQTSASERKDIRSDNKKRGIGKKSLSFLIKKAAFLRRGGFVPSPMLRDPVQDLKLDHSRMDKILRAMLHKKIYPQRPTTPKKCLEIDQEEHEVEEEKHESKWVKTDSEYIVLEI